MTDNKSNLVSAGRKYWQPHCGTCPFFIQDTQYFYHGWCGNSDNLVITESWPNGFTPSVQKDGGCDFHPEAKPEERDQWKPIWELLKPENYNKVVEVEIEGEGVFTGTITDKGDIRFDWITHGKLLCWRFKE